tara:strand:+ start:1127 stop:1717 length:591 start_codon:yes stop_codon:yes gene_type:complete
MESINLKSNKDEYIQGPLIIKPTIYKDERGHFFESWNKKNFQKLIERPVEFVQDNQSFSKKGVLRGMHFQLSPYAQGKLVKCITGSIFDVLIDLRETSPTFLHWTSLEINDVKKYTLWIPEGFAHGFLTLSKTARVLYKTTNYWAKDFEKCIKWNDDKFNIKWPLNRIKDRSPTLSQKDTNGLTYQEALINGFFFK